MFFILYDLIVLALTLMWLPKAFYERLRYGKYKDSFWQKMAIDPRLKNAKFRGSLIWVHAVSVGEVRAISSVVRKLHLENPNLSFVISTVTETGQAEAKKRMPFAQYFCYLPLDISWVMRRKMFLCQPKAVIICETDFWLNFLSEAKRIGAKVVLVNGKLSDRSYKRFKALRFFSKKLFKSFDLLCLQNKEYENKFASLGIEKEKLVVTGNLKFDIDVPFLDSKRRSVWNERIGSCERQIITIGSTHEGEEKKILDLFIPLFVENPHLLLILVPRHPERFTAVAAILEQMKISFVKWSEKNNCSKETQVLLLDTMGELLSAYELSSLAIVAGSFVSGIGGHNVCEPANYGVPVLFGPYTEDQKELIELVKSYKSGMQVPIERLARELQSLLKDPQRRDQLGENGKLLARDMIGSSDKTIQYCNDFRVLPVKDSE